MSEYIIEWSGIGADMTDMLNNHVPPCLWPKRIRKDRRRERIVRCRDCKYANEDGDECVYFAAWEPLPGGDEFRDVYVDVEPNGFCAWAERRQA